MASRWEQLPLSDGYKYPQNMPESLLEVKEGMKKRPYYCYRIFVNNVDHYVSREIAKFFNGEYFLTPEVINGLKDAPKPPEEEKEDDKKGKSKKGGRRQSKRSSKAGSRKSSIGRRSSKRASKGGGSRRGSRKSTSSKKSSGSRKSTSSRKSTGGRKSMSRKSMTRKSMTRKSMTRKSVSGKGKSQAGGKRKSRISRLSTKGRKGKKQMLKVGPPADPEEIEKMIEELWPKFRRDEPIFSKLYDWDADYPYLEDLRLISNERIGFDIERARQYHSAPIEWDEDLKRRMRERAWMYTRCIPPCGGLISEGEPIGDWPFFMDPPPDSPPLTPGPGGDSGGKPRQITDYLKPNVINLAKQFRSKLWKEDGGEKSLNFYNEDLFWGYPSHQVVATRVNPLPEGETPPYYIFETVKNFKTREDYVRDVFPCMLQIYDITKSPDCIEEAKMALDFLIDELKTYSEEVRLKNQALFGIHTYILISPLLTWAETRSLAMQPQDPLREEYFRKRVPHPMYKKHWEFENYVYEKAYECRDLLKIIIIGVGVVYGNGDNELKPYYELARRNITPVMFLGRGYNIVPLVHIEDLARLCLQFTREFPSYTRYIIAAEKAFRSTAEIMDIIAQGIAEGYVSNVPYCFGKAFNIVGEDTHNLLYNEFKFNCTYLHDIKKHGFRHDFGADIKATFAQYEKEQGYRPIRLVLFGPSDADQRKIGEAIAAHYKIPYINGFSAVKTFLRILLDLQNQILDSVMPKVPPRSWRLVEGKTEYYQFKVSGPLAWHREHRLLFRRDPKLEELRDKHFADAKRKDPTICRVADVPRQDFFETENLNKAEPQNPKLQEAKDHLLNFDRLKQGGADLLGALIRVDIQAMIVHELLKFPTCRNHGYVLDGLPTTEEEAEMIFRKDGVAPAAPPPPPQLQTTPSVGAPPPKQPQPTASKVTMDDYAYLPSHVFHIKKCEMDAFRDLIKGGKAANFQKDFMTHFRRMQMHKLLMNRTRSALDFFEDKFDMLTYCFDSGATPVDEIVKNIIEMIDQPSAEDLLFKPDSDEKIVDVKVTQEQSFIKKQLGVYSEDDYPVKPAEKARPLEPWEIEVHKKDASWLSCKSAIPEVPLRERTFTPEELEEARKMGEKMVHEVVKLPDRALGFLHYLNKFVSKSVIKAAITAPGENPEDLIDWTAFYLMANNEGAKMPLNKVIPPPPPVNLSEYPFYVDKHDPKYVKHLE